MLFGLRPARLLHKAHEYKAGAQIASSCNSAFQASVLSNSRGCDWIERHMLD